MQYHSMLREDDCLRTAIACVLDRDPSTVPNFGEIRDPVKHESSYRDWLYAEGFGVVSFPWIGRLPDFMAFMKYSAPDSVWILGAYVAPGVRHAFIAHGGEVIHDPAPKGSGLPPLDQLGLQGTFLVPGRSVIPPGHLPKEIEPAHAM